MTLSYPVSTFRLQPATKGPPGPSGRFSGLRHADPSGHLGVPGPEQ